MDSDGVFVSHVFKQWLGENNIRPEYCQPRRHQQNGAAEASIKSINDMARCMLVASGLPGKYWGYAVHHAAFVRNRVVSSNLDASPYFKAFNKQPDLKMLQEFGSEVYALNDDARKFKLGDKTVKDRFLGYSVDTGSPSALVLLKSGKVLRSRDVVFSPTSAQLAQWETTEADPLDWLAAQTQSGSVGAADAPVSQQWEPVSDGDSSGTEPALQREGGGRRPQPSRLFGGRRRAEAAGGRRTNKPACLGNHPVPHFFWQLWIALLRKEESGMICGDFGRQKGRCCICRKNLPLAFQSRMISCDACEVRMQENKFSCCC